MTHAGQRRCRLGVWTFAFALLIGPWCAAASEYVPELLILESGDRLSGQSLSIEDGYLHWLLEGGRELTIPLEWVERVDLDPVQPAAHEQAVPPPPAPPVTEPSVAGPDTGAAERPWTESVPLYTTIHQGYVTAGQAYTAFNDLASTWTRRIQLSGQFIDGNAQTDLISLQVEFENSRPEFMRQIDVGGQWARNRNRQTANRWFANGNFDWRLDDSNEKWIMFFTSKNEYDAPANLDYRGTLSTGLGYRFYNEAKKRLITRFGPAYTIEVFRDPSDHRESPDLFGELEIRWPVLKRMSFEQKMRVQPSVLDFELVRVFSTTGVLVDLDDKDRWKLRLGLNYTYNSQPNPGREPSDYVSSLSLVYMRK